MNKTLLVLNDLISKANDKSNDMELIGPIGFKHRTVLERAEMKDLISSIRKFPLVSVAATTNPEPTQFALVNMLKTLIANDDLSVDSKAQRLLSTYAARIGLEK